MVDTRTVQRIHQDNMLAAAHRQEIMQPKTIDDGGDDAAINVQ